MLIVSLIATFALSLNVLSVNSGTALPGSLLSLAVPVSEISDNPQQQESEPKNVVTFFWAESGAEQTVTGTPFIAVAVIETSQTLADGNRFVNHSTQKLARDSKGRTRREQVIGKIGGLQVEGPTMVFIYDPVAKIEYTLDPSLHTARATKLRTISLPRI